MNKVLAESGVKQLDDLIAQYEDLPWERSGFGDSVYRSNDSLRMRMYAAIERLAPRGSQYTLKLETKGLESVSEIAKALRADIAAGYLQNTSELIHADLFADMLEAADYLLNEGWKDAAAVMIGGVLETQLRKLCQKNQIETDRQVGNRTEAKKADGMNAELYAAAVYNKLQNKEVTSWLGLRNDAAHAHYSNYDQQQVKNMLDGVSAFIIKYPA